MTKTLWAAAIKTAPPYTAPDSTTHAVFATHTYGATHVDTVKQLATLIDASHITIKQKNALKWVVLSMLTDEWATNFNTHPIHPTYTYKIPSTTDCYRRAHETVIQATSGYLANHSDISKQTSLFNAAVSLIVIRSPLALLRIRMKENDFEALLKSTLTVYSSHAQYTPFIIAHFTETLLIHTPNILPFKLKSIVDDQVRTIFSPSHTPVENIIQYTDPFLKATCVFLQLHPIWSAKHTPGIIFSPEILPDGSRSPYLDTQIPTAPSIKSQLRFLEHASSKPPTFWDKNITFGELYVHISESLSLPEPIFYVGKPAIPRVVDTPTYILDPKFPEKEVVMFTSTPENIRSSDLFELCLARQTAAIEMYNVMSAIDVSPEDGSLVFSTMQKHSVHAIPTCPSSVFSHSFNIIDHMVALHTLLRHVNIVISTIKIFGTPKSHTNQQLKIISTWHRVSTTYNQVITGLIANDQPIIKNLREYVIDITKTAIDSTASDLMREYIIPVYSPEDTVSPLDIVFEYRLPATPVFDCTIFEHLLAIALLQAATAEEVVGTLLYAVAIRHAPIDKRRTFCADYLSKKLVNWPNYIAAADAYAASHFFPESQAV